MSKLLLNELETGGIVTQAVSVGSKNVFTKYIRLHLYKHGHPPGGMTVEVRDANGKTIGSSSEVTVAAIDADNSSADFFHGLVRFTISTPLKASTTYYVTLKANGTYAFSETASGSTGYIGWCKDFDWRKYPADWDLNIGVNSALIYEFIAQQEIER